MIASPAFDPRIGHTFAADVPVTMPSQSFHLLASALRSAERRAAFGGATLLLSRLSFFFAALSVSSL